MLPDSPVHFMVQLEKIGDFWNVEKNEESDDIYGLEE
jgi:hypothetical protein